MNLSMNWLRDYVELDMEPRRFCEAMTMSGSKVESYRNTGDGIANVVAGRIRSVEKHPNADKLVVCSVDVGKEEPLTIVTGADNVFAGALVPVALHNSTLPGGKKITRGKLRGILSDGMLCSLGELGLAKGDFPYAAENGIFIMEEKAALGQDIREVLGLDDTVVEFEITPNRPDCLSVLGLAREVAVTFGRTMRLPDTAVKGGAGKTSDFVRVDVQAPALCPRYMARAVKNVKIGPSPRWLRERLRAAGVRPISNIVDITNFVMLEYGQPMHAFDLRTLKGGEIHVRPAGEGETITTLDGTERRLCARDLVIADAEKPVAIAGVMGGEFSGIGADTSTIVFESALFDPACVRLTSKRLGLRTEASSRYEKGLDAQNTLPALERACRLAELLGAGEPCADAVDIDHSAKEPRKITLDDARIRALLGVNIPRAQMEDTLRRLEFKVEGDTVSVPSFRGDVEGTADLAEEVARIYGYDRIPCTMPGGAVRGGLTPAQKFDKNVAGTLLALGFSEISTFSFISPKYYDKILLPADSPLRRSVTLRRPLGEDTSIMRTTMLPSMLETLALNFADRNLSARLYELGSVYLPGENGGLPRESAQLALGAYGEGEDFYALKGDIEELCAAAGIPARSLSFEPCSEYPSFHPGRCAKLSADGALLGVLGEIHPHVQENYGIDARVFAALLDETALRTHAAGDRRYTPLPKFPATARDLAVTCGEDTPVMTLENAMRKAAGSLLETIELFDVYRGKQIAAGKKSVAFRLSMRAADRTLTDAEADATVARVLKELGSLGAELRS